MSMLDFIPYGKDNAVTRQELVKLTGFDDRTVRNEIKKLRAEGEPILSSSHHVGYWRSDNPNEIEGYLRECDSRCKALFMTNCKMKKRLYEMMGQRYITVREHLRRIG